MRTHPISSRNPSTEAAAGILYELDPCSPTTKARFISGLENLSAVNSDWLAAYGSAFPTKEDCIGAIEFPLDVLLGRVFPYIAEGFPLVDNLKLKPAMLAVGMKDRAISPAVQIADSKESGRIGPLSSCPMPATSARRMRRMSSLP
jgi:hypothetical protein